MREHIYVLSIFSAIVVLALIGTVLSISGTYDASSTGYVAKGKTKNAYEIRGGVYEKGAYSTWYDQCIAQTIGRGLDPEYLETNTESTRCYEISRQYQNKGGGGKIGLSYYQRQKGGNYEDVQRATGLGDGFKEYYKR